MNEPIGERKPKHYERAFMSNVVVTGGYGFIGAHLVSALLDRGDSVTVFDSQRTPATTVSTSTGMPTSGSCRAMSLIWPHSKKP